MALCREMFFLKYENDSTMEHYLAEIKISLAFTPMLVRPLAKYAASDAFQNFLLSLVYGVVAVKRFKF